MTNRNYTDDSSFGGKLIIVEGIDGSGKSTQLSLLQKWLESKKYRVFKTEWNSSALVKETIKKGKKRDILSPLTFSILHAADFADRYFNLIIPPLKAGMIVLADRYIYTAFSRDKVRGVNEEWVRDLYGFAVKPDVALYFDIPIEVSLKRILAGRSKIKYHEAGMDMGLSNDIIESFKIFQTRIREEYMRVASEFGLKTIDGSEEIQTQQMKVRKIIDEKLSENNSKISLTGNGK